MWTEREISISEIKNLLESDYEIEVDSPDGWVKVTEFVDKGSWQEYILKIESIIIRCNENHLFETKNGWKFAKDLVNTEEEFLTQCGWKKGIVEKTDNIIPIVDIQVDHNNHRYYTEGVSSHNTNVGKSLVMCHMAADNLRLGKNVLYITCEMSEEKIASRIDANLLDLTMDDIHYMEKDSYCKRFETIRETTMGKLVVKEYPTSTANINHFRHLLHELKLKKKFIPDIIYIDYINICASSKMKNNGSTGSYQYIKTIAEEVRSFAQENKLPIVSATQLNRDGAKKKEVEITDTSESWGLPATCDFMFGLYVNHELDELGRMKWFTIKTRDADKSKFRTFLIGLDRAKMKLYDVDNEKENVDVVGETAEFNEDFEIDLKTGNLKQKLKFNV
jgi:hypothetical protein